MECFVPTIVVAVEVFFFASNITCVCVLVKLWNAFFESAFSGWVLHGMLYWIIAKQWKFVCVRKMLWPPQIAKRTAYVQTALLILCDIKHFDLHSLGSGARAISMAQWFFSTFLSVIYS